MVPTSEPLRYRRYLAQRYRALLSYAGSNLIFVGLLLLVPLLTLPFFPDEVDHAWSFVLAGLGLAALGFTMYRVFMPDESTGVTIQEGMVIVLLVWLMAILFGTIPFLLISDLSFTLAMFESTSGWTTTGLTVVDVTTAPNILLFYRSYIQLIGGAGFVIITLSAITGPFGSGISLAEGHSERLAPHVRRSAAIVLRIYLAYIGLGSVALRVAGMSWFDAVNHAFTAVATGGFSTRPESIGFWDNPLIEVIVIVLMLLGSLNFLTAYTLFRGKLYAFVRNAELRLVGVVLPIAFLLLLLFTTPLLYEDWGQRLRVAIFETTSSLSGTGFNLANHSTLNSFGWLVLIILMVIGGGSGSTAGGIKQYRIYVMYKALSWEYRRAFLPPHVVNEPAFWQGDQRGFLSDRLIRQIALFVFLYLAIWLTGTAITAAHGYPLGDSLYEFSSALGTVGLSVGLTSPDAPPSLLWTFIAGMFLGRLEFYAVSIGLAKIVIDLLAMRPPRQTERTRI